MLRRLEGEIDLKRKQLTTLRIDATSLEAVKQLKGKFTIVYRQHYNVTKTGRRNRPEAQTADYAVNRRDQSGGSQTTQRLV